jgi:hypothetical protein
MLFNIKILTKFQYNGHLLSAHLIITSSHIYDSRSTGGEGSRNFTRGSNTKSESVKKKKLSIE